MNKPGLKVFVVNNEKIQVIFPKNNSQTLVMKDIIFEIKWDAFDRIVLRKKSLNNTEIIDPRLYKVIQFIGDEITEFYYLNRFHKLKQIEITLLLEDFANKMGKKFIEK